MSGQSYAEQVAAAAAEQLRQTQGSYPEIPSVTVEVAGGQLVFRFTLADRPGVEYGYRIEAVPDEGPESESPAVWAAVVLANWRERVLADDLPLEGIREEGVVWLTDD